MRLGYTLNPSNKYNIRFVVFVVDAVCLLQTNKHQHQTRLTELGLELSKVSRKKNVRKRNVTKEKTHIKPGDIQRSRIYINYLPVSLAKFVTIIYNPTAIELTATQRITHFFLYSMFGSHFFHSFSFSLWVLHRNSHSIDSLLVTCLGKKKYSAPNFCKRKMRIDWVICRIQCQFDVEGLWGNFSIKKSINLFWCHTKF